MTESNYAFVPQWLYDQFAAKDRRIAELEQHIALFEEFVARDDAWTLLDEAEYQVGTHSKAWVEALKARCVARTALAAWSDDE